MHDRLAELIILVSRVLLIGLNCLVGLRRGFLLSLVHLLFLWKGLVSYDCLICLLLWYLLWLRFVYLVVLWLCLFHVYYFTCWIVEFRLFAFFHLLRTLLALLLSTGLRFWLCVVSCWHYFSLYLLLSLFFILISLVWRTWELLLWRVASLDSTIRVRLFLVLSNL